MMVRNGLATLDVLSLGAYLYRTLIFELCVVKCGFKNGHHKFIMYLKEIG